MTSPTKYLRLFLFFFTVFISGISTEFEADVRWTCSDDIVSVFVRTPQPFEGLIQAHSSTSDACRVQGFGTNVAVLKLRLKSEECGMKYDKTTKTHYITVNVHSHPVLIVKGDKTVNITCREIENGTHFGSQSDSPIPSDYQLRVLGSRLPVETVKYSQPYTLQVRPLPHRQNNALGFFVGQCTAQPIGGNVTVQLTDPVGCALFKSIMGNFGRRESVEEADIPSMFRFPDAKQLKISCVVTECDGNCETRSCDTDASASSLLEKTTSSVEAEEGQKAWIIVNLEEPNQIIVAKNVDETKENVHRDNETPPPNMIVKKERDEILSTECVTEFEFKLLYYLCIFLAVCSIIGFTMNIILAILLKRRSTGRKMPPISVEQLKIPKGTTQQPDFWIHDDNRDMPNEHNYFGQRRDSLSSYASVRRQQQQQTRRIPTTEYGVPAPSRSSAASSSDDRSSNEVYRRPPQMAAPRPEIRHSNSTFMTHSTTMETDIDSSQGSTNQATSYH